MFIEIDDEGHRLEYRRECPETTEELFELMATSDANTLYRFRELVNHINELSFTTEPIQVMRVTRRGMTDFLFTKKPNAAIVKSSIDELKLFLSLL